MKYQDNEIGGREVESLRIRPMGVTTMEDALAYANIGRKIAGDLKHRLQLGGVESGYSPIIRLQDGTLIQAVSNMIGLAHVDEVRVDTKHKSKKEVTEKDKCTGLIIHMKAIPPFGGTARLEGPRHSDTVNDYISTTTNINRETTQEEDEFKAGEFDGTFEYVDLNLNYAANTYLVFYGTQDDFFSQTHTMPRHPDAEGDFFPPPQSTHEWSYFAPHVTEIQAAFEQEWTDTEAAGQAQVAASYESASIQNIKISPTRTERSDSNYVSIHGVTPTAVNGFGHINFSRSSTEGVITAVPFDIEYTFSDDWETAYSFHNIFDDDFLVVSISSLLIVDETFGNLNYSGGVGYFIEGTYYDEFGVLHTDEGTDFIYDGFTGNSNIADGDYEITGSGELNVYFFCTKKMERRRYIFSAEETESVIVEIGKEFTDLSEVIRVRKAQ